LLARPRDAAISAIASSSDVRPARTRHAAPACAAISAQSSASPGEPSSAVGVPSASWSERASAA